MELNKKKDDRSVIPITVYTNDRENPLWKQEAYKEHKMLSKFVRDIVNDYLDAKRKTPLWRR